jgi:cytochrome c
MTKRTAGLTMAMLGAGLAFATGAQADGNVAAGQALFQGKCGLCHSPEKGVNKIGPSLWGVVGRPAGSLPTYTYSDAMKNANRVWNADTLNVYLTNPQKDIPGVKMIFAGYPDAQDRANVIAYLSTLK